MKTSLYYNNLFNVQKKLANKVIFNKSYLKNSEFSKTAYTLDNYYTTSFFKTKKNAMFNSGSSINSATNIFINKLNKKIKFQLNTCVFTKQELDLYKFFKTLESAKKLAKNFGSLIFLKIVKGGFKCYYFGIIGFLPRVQANKSFKNLANTLQSTYNLKNLKQFLMCFKKSIQVTEKSLLRLGSFSLNNLCVYPAFKKKIFSSASKKSRLFLNDINVVFVFKSSV